MSKLTFQKINKSNMNLLDVIRGEELHKLHLDRIEKQMEGSVTYIIAFDKKEPVGHILITYEKSFSWHNYPAIEDLYVKENARHKGFAKQIMDHAESLVKQKGYNKICLDTETKEHWIRKFYESLGYKKISGVHELIYFIEQKDQRKKHIEYVNYFEKIL